MNLVSMNIMTPSCPDKTVLEVVSAGLGVFMDGYYNKGLSTDDFTIREHASLTMADHVAELSINDSAFEMLYEAAQNVMNSILLTQWVEIETFLNTLTGYEDLIALQYPGMIKLMVNEEYYHGSTGSSYLYLS